MQLAQRFMAIREISTGAFRYQRDMDAYEMSIPLLLLALSMANWSDTQLHAQLWGSIRTVGDPLLVEVTRLVIKGDVNERICRVSSHDSGPG